MFLINEINIFHNYYYPILSNIVGGLTTPNHHFVAPIRKNKNSPLSYANNMKSILVNVTFTTDNTI